MKIEIFKHDSETIIKLVAESDAEGYQIGYLYRSAIIQDVAQVCDADNNGRSFIEIPVKLIPK